MDKEHIIDGTGPRSADVLVCGFSEPPGSEFPPPIAAASLVSAANQLRTLDVERCMLNVECFFPLHRLIPAPRPLTSGASGRSPIRVQHSSTQFNRGKNPVKNKEKQRKT
jgi:hypothetical protein